MLNEAKAYLKKYYGYDSFRKGQEKVVSSLLSGRDTIAIMPTGAGKSICFQIPALLLSGVTIVVSPLISLMKDQVDALAEQGIPATFLNSTLSAGEMNNRLYGIAANKYKLIYIAPERLDSESFAPLKATLNISMVAIDEAHCMSQWGHDFRPSYAMIAPFINSLPHRPLIGAFTATATPEVKDDIIQLLSLNEPAVFVTGFDRPNLFFSVLHGENKEKFLLNYVRNHPNQSGIVYAATRKEVDSIYELLKHRGFAVGRYHAGMSDDERTAEQERFLFDESQIVAATNAFGMGIDKSNVRYVIHWNMPKNMESYYQEAGRSGRDGEPGECILLYSPQDIMLQKFLIDKSVENPVRKQNELNKLQSMIQYCQTSNCLHRYIMEYFGEADVPEECGNCENCNADSEEIDITIDAQKVLSCVYRLHERFGITIIAEVLKGSNTQKVRQFNFNELPTYGIMQEYTLNEIKSIVQYLTAMHYLKLSDGEFPVYQLTAAAYAVLKGQQQVFRKIIKTRKLEIKDDLFTALRSVRKQLAQAAGIPPYQIFSDATLREMSTVIPLSLDDMQSVKGIGEVKLKRYGQTFLNEILLYTAKNPAIQQSAVTTDITAKAPAIKTAAASAKPKTKKMPTHLISAELFLQGATPEEIANERGIQQRTIEAHIFKAFKEGLELNLDYFIPSGAEPIIRGVIDRIGSSPLRAVKEALPDNISYPAIQAVICKYY